MSLWFRKNLGDALLAWEELGQIEELFLSLYGKDNSSNEVAVFIRHESEGHLHCEVKAYFSPSLVMMAGQVDADPCKRPSLDGLSLLVGSEDSWSSLFPELGK
jgi:hypothetical protein